MWDRTGQKVKGVYLNEYTVEGIVESSRVKYGGKIQHTVRLSQSTVIFGELRKFLLLNEENLI